MKLDHEAFEPDTIDLQIIATLQEHGRIPLVKLGEQVGLSAPSVIERVKKLEDGGVITGYHASVDARQLGKDVTAFIGVSIAPSRSDRDCSRRPSSARRRARMPSRHRRAHGAAQGQDRQHFDARGPDQHDPLDRGVTRTETMVVLSTHTERTQISVSSSRRDRASQATAGAIATASRKSAVSGHQEGMMMHQLPQHSATRRVSTIPRTSTTRAASASSSTSRASARTTSCRRASRCSTT